MGFLLEQQKGRFQQYLEHLEQLTNEQPRYVGLQTSDGYSTENYTDSFKDLVKWLETDGDVTFAFQWRSGSSRLTFAVDLEDGMVTFGLTAYMYGSRSQRFHTYCEDALSEDERIRAAAIYTSLKENKGVTA